MTPKASLTRRRGPGADRLAQIAAVIRGRQVVWIGVLSGAGGKGDHAHGKARISVAELAAIHEFGLGVPERSFLRGWLAEKGANVGEALVRLTKRHGPGPIALELWGQWAAGSIQQRIAKQIPPPLAKVTIDRKGSSIPLIDTGQLRSSITYRVARS